jgi:hypothetical protein
MRSNDSLLRGKALRRLQRISAQEGVVDVGWRSHDPRLSCVPLSVHVDDEPSPQHAMVPVGLGPCKNTLTRKLTGSPAARARALREAMA